MTQEERDAVILMLGMFNIDGRPANEVATEGQIEIFFELVFRKHRRLQILCSTQYGKSLFVALACIIITCCQHEVIAVIAPTNEKAKIIMRYYIAHLGDHKEFVTELEKDTKLERLRMEESKERIMLKHGGGIFVISAQSGNSKKSVEAAMGAGAKNVIQDESGLITDQSESTVFRMISGKGEEAFYCKIGNPFYRNVPYTHFYKSWKDPAYHKIFIDYKRGMMEGRYNAQFIDEARKKPLFGVLYECIFPGEDNMDSGGFLQLIPTDRVSVRPKMDMPFIQPVILGIDPAGEGKDKATFCIRDRFKAEIVHEVPISNPRQLSEIALTLMDKYQVDPMNVVNDAFGVGADIGKEIAIATKGKAEIYTVLLGNKPKDEEEYNGRFFRRLPEEQNDEDDIYMNLRALMFFRARAWLFAGGQIIDDAVDNSTFKNELCVVKYKRSLQGNTIQLMSKKDMQALGISSPNKADALALTFLRSTDNPTQTKEEREQITREDTEIDDRFAIF